MGSYRKIGSIVTVRKLVYILFFLVAKNFGNIYLFYSLSGRIVNEGKSLPPFSFVWTEQIFRITSQNHLIRRGFQKN